MICLLLEYGDEMAVDWRSFSLENHNACIYDYVSTFDLQSNTLQGLLALFAQYFLAISNALTMPFLWVKNNSSRHR